MQNALVPIALFGWIPLAAGMFLLLSPRRAVLASFLIGWLFLPQGAIAFDGLPDLDKITATSVGAMFGMLIFDPSRLMRYRAHWCDIPIIAWCLVPIASSISNGLGLYDGLATSLEVSLTWGVPYLLGRLYLTDLVALRDLAMTFVIGGLVYVPLCLFEIRMSPQLHRTVYGFHQHSFGQTLRWGGYRPMIFMQHGLMLGLWMTASSIALIWMWRTKALRHLRGIPAGLLVPVQVGTTILCKSTGALALLAGAIALMFSVRRLRVALPMIVAVAIVPGYVALRASGQWSGGQLVELAEEVSPKRADSLAGRYRSEDLMLQFARQRQWLGWGQTDGWREKEADTSIAADALWLIVIGRHGVVGITVVLLVLLLPIVLLMRRVPVRAWATPAVAPAAAVSFVLLVYALDNLVNAMLNPVFMLGAGGLCGLYATTVRRPLALGTPTVMVPVQVVMPGPNQPGAVAHQ